MSLSIGITTPVKKLGHSPKTSSMPAPHPEKLGNPTATLSLYADGTGDELMKVVLVRHVHCEAC